MYWQLIDPVEPCHSPLGHMSETLMTQASNVPFAAICSQCSARFTIVTSETPFRATAVR